MMTGFHARESREGSWPDMARTTGGKSCRNDGISRQRVTRSGSSPDVDTHRRDLPSRSRDSTPGNPHKKRFPSGHPQRAGFPIVITGFSAREPAQEKISVEVASAGGIYRHDDGIFRQGTCTRKDFRRGGLSGQDLPS